jgi:hypothetical protein
MTAKAIRRSYYSISAFQIVEEILLENMPREEAEKHAGELVEIHNSLGLPSHKNYQASLICINY